ncbi:MAG: radical SAM protein [Nitrospirales bacterium]|nr:radical SAM protein [Nitrospirales bacterium]
MATDSERGNPSSDRKVYYETTTMCPECEELVPGQVVGRGGRIYLERTCSDHGFSAALICTDTAWFESLPDFDVEPIRPKNAGKAVSGGCPRDCGLCVAHRQIAGTAAIEISNECNAACPVCLADNRSTFRISLDELKASVDTLFRSQERLETFTISGGEPTIHPELFSMLDYLQGRNIDRIVVNSNGIRIAEDDAFLERLSHYPRVCICLHFDGSRSHLIRGIGNDTQERALRRLCDRGIGVVPLVLAVQDINDAELGHLVERLLTESESIKSLILSMMTYSGSRGSRFQGDMLNRMTITGALEAIEKESGGKIRKSHFIPLPMPNPLCAAIGYFLVQDNEIIPLIPLRERAEIVDITKNTHFGRIGEEMQSLLTDTIYSLYAEPEKYENAEAALQGLKKLHRELFPEDRKMTVQDCRETAEKRVKTVYLMQFMDKWTFDTSRLSKCSCQHLLPGGRIIPSCLYYAYHRKFDPRFTT